MKNLKRLTKFLTKDIKENKILYGAAFLLLLIAFITRVWRMDVLLGFYYDQGRDALVIQRILNGDLVLIGPTTGLKGIFLGPFYYYLMAPGYFLGQGSPVFASYYQTFLVVLGYFISFLIVRFSISKIGALVVLFILTFSYPELQSSRWLSNPTPAALFSPLAIFFLSMAFKNPKKFLPLGAFCLGLMLQLEASSSFFLMLITIILVAIYHKRFGLKAIGMSAVAFFVTLIPQLIFELKNDFLLTRNLLGFLHHNTYTDTAPTFKIPTMATFEDRVRLFSTTYLDKLALDTKPYAIPVFVILLLLVLWCCYKNWEKPIVKVAAAWFLGTLVAFTFYNGNYGFIYSYYFNPIMPAFWTIVALLVTQFWKNKVFKGLLVVGLVMIIFIHSKPTWGYLNSGIGPETIAFKNQSDAVQYVLKKGVSEPYNLDVYVPPSIPYTYIYLFEYYGKRVGNRPSGQLVKTLYTIHEIDLEIPNREKKWLERQDGIGKVVEKERFGGIGVEKRERQKYE